MSDKPTSRPSRKVGKSTKTKSAAKPAAKTSAKPATAPKKKRAPKKKVDTLEYEIVGKVASVKVSDKTIKLKKWGMAQRFQLGARVALVMEHLEPFMPKDGEEVNAMFLISILGQLIDDISFIIIESTVDTFDSHDDGIEWLDYSCNPEDLFTLGHIIYDMNLKDKEAMGKLTKGMEKLAQRIDNLSN